MKAARLATPALAGGDAPLSVLRGVGAGVAEKLAARGLATIQDLWLHLPLRYEDRTRLVPIRSLQAGVAAQVEGTIEAVEEGTAHRPAGRSHRGHVCRRLSSS